MPTTFIGKRFKSDFFIFYLLFLIIIDLFIFIINGFLNPFNRFATQTDLPLKPVIIRLNLLQFKE